MIEQTTAKKNYFPFAFPVSLALTDINIRKVKKRDVPNLLKEKIRDMIIFEHDDYSQICFKDFFELSQAKNIMVSIAKLIIILNSCHYYHNRTGEKATPFVSSYVPNAIFTTAVLAVFTIEEMLPPKLDIDKQRKIGITAEEAQRIVFNANQRVFHMLKQSFVTPHQINNSLKRALVSAHNVGFHNSIYDYDDRQHLNDLVQTHSRKERFIVTYSKFFLKYLVLSFGKKTFEERIPLETFIPEFVLLDEKFEQIKKALLA